MSYAQLHRADRLNEIKVENDKISTFP